MKDFSQNLDDAKIERDKRDGFASTRFLTYTIYIDVGIVLYEEKVLSPD
jgi:hypothetical protein